MSYHIHTIVVEPLLFAECSNADETRIVAPEPSNICNRTRLFRHSRVVATHIFIPFHSPSRCRRTRDHAWWRRSQRKWWRRSQLPPRVVRRLLQSRSPLAALPVTFRCLLSSSYAARAAGSGCGHSTHIHIRYLPKKEIGKGDRKVGRRKEGTATGALGRSA